MWLLGNGFKYESKLSSIRNELMIYVLNLEALLWKLILTSYLKILRKSDKKNYKFFRKYHKMSTILNKTRPM